MLVIVRQIRAARSLMGWGQNDLAIRSGVAVSTIRHIEGLKDIPVSAHFEAIEKIRRCFEHAGMEFLGYPCPGVRLGLTEAHKDAPASWSC